MTFATTPRTLPGSLTRLGTSKDFMSNFDGRSVLLMATLSYGLVTALAMAPAHAQMAAPPAAQGAAAGQSATAAPAGAGKTTDAAFDRVDTNKDGKLDKKEAEKMPAIAERFDQLDANGDGTISKEEFAKAAGG